MEDSKMTRSEAGKIGNIKRAENIKKRYEENPKKCKHCGKVIPYEFRHMKVFCDHSCSAIFNNKLRGWRIEKNKCKNCGKECDNTFCSRKCVRDYEYNENIMLWKSGDKSGLTSYNICGFVRRYMFEKYESKCCKCGWCEVNKKTGNVPLQINHIDGDHKNNSEDNLELVCPNCHSLTENFGSLNRGKGRNKRRQRYHEGKTS